MEREPAATLPAQDDAFEDNSTRERDKAQRQQQEEAVPENAWGRFDVFDLSLAEVKRRPRRVASFGERQRTQEVRQRGACSICRTSKRKCTHVVAEGDSSTTPKAHVSPEHSQDNKSAATRPILNTLLAETEARGIAEPSTKVTTDNTFDYDTRHVERYRALSYDAPGDTNSPTNNSTIAIVQPEERVSSSQIPAPTKEDVRQTRWTAAEFHPWIHRVSSPSVTSLSTDPVFAQFALENRQRSPHTTEVSLREVRQESPCYSLSLQEASCHSPKTSCGPAPWPALSGPVAANSPMDISSSSGGPSSWSPWSGNEEPLHSTIASSRPSLFGDSLVLSNGPTYLSSPPTAPLARGFGLLEGVPLEDEPLFDEDVPGFDVQSSDHPDKSQGKVLDASSIYGVSSLSSWTQSAYNVSDKTDFGDLSSHGTRPLVKRHRATHSRSTSSSVNSCEDCGKIFSSKSEKDHHARWHGPKNQVCGVCGKGFIALKDLRRHERIHRPVGHEFFCDVSGCIYGSRGFARKDHFLRHQKTHSSTVLLPEVPR